MHGFKSMDACVIQGDICDLTSMLFWLYGVDDKVKKEIKVCLMKKLSNSSKEIVNPKPLLEKGEYEIYDLKPDTLYYDDKVGKIKFQVIWRYCIGEYPEFKDLSVCEERVRR